MCFRLIYTAFKTSSLCCLRSEFTQSKMQLLKAVYQAQQIFHAGDLRTFMVCYVIENFLAFVQNRNTQNVN